MLIKSSSRRLSRTNKLESIDWFTLHLSQLPIYIDDYSVNTTEHIVDGITKLEAKDVEIGLVIIDDFESVVRSDGVC